MLNIELHDVISLAIIYLFKYKTAIMSYTSYPLVINKSHWIGGSTYRYSFGSSTDLSHKSIALEKATVWFSFPNITTALSNNTFSIIHPTNSGTTTLAFTIPDGGYDIDALNIFLRWSLINQGYFIQNNATGDQTVYCQFRVNAATYQVEFVSYPLPTSLPSGFTAGSSITFPATAKGPQLIVGTTGFGTVIGFSIGSFPSSQPTVITTTGSTKIPVVSSVQNVVITLDSCFNPYCASNSKVIHSFSVAGASYASLITSEPKSLSFIPQQTGWRSEITIQLCDQFLQPLNLTDPDATIILQLRTENQ
jgi:hypothetical protein